MWSKDDENFWSSTQKGLDFKEAEKDEIEDNELEEDLDEPAAIFNETSSRKNIYPIDKIISNDCLENILRCSNPIKVKTSANSVDDVIKCLMLDQKVSLDFAALSDKVLLLDKAIESRRGLIIKKIVVYLDKTLIPKIFYPLLVNRLIALNHLELHYMQEQRIESLGTLYTMTGKSNVARLFALHCPSSTKTSKNLINVQKFQMQFQPLMSSFESEAIKKYRTFLEFQTTRNIAHCKSVSECFAMCVKISDFNKLEQDINKLNISTEHADWIIMNVYMHNKKYDNLEKRFLNKSKTTWLKNLAFKSNLHVETLISGMAEHKPEPRMLEPFLSMLKDDSKLSLGHKFGCYDYVVKLYCDKRDKNGLIAYKSKFPNNSTFLHLIDEALSDTSIKWKN